MKQSDYTGQNWNHRFSRQSNWDRGYYAQPKQATKIPLRAWVGAAAFIAYLYALFYFGAQYF